MRKKNKLPLMLEETPILSFKKNNKSLSKQRISSISSDDPNIAAKITKPDIVISQAHSSTENDDEIIKDRESSNGTHNETDEKMNDTNLSNSDIYSIDSSNTDRSTVKSRRRALKDFYQLQASQHSKSEHIGNDVKQKEKKVKDTNKYLEELSLDNFDEFIKNADFPKLLKMENDVLDDLNTYQSEIKSIIYNNYYELIKINDVLANLKRRNEVDLSEGEGAIKDNLQKIKRNLNSLSNIDLDMFGDKNATEDLTTDMETKVNLGKSINRLLLSKDPLSEDTQQKLIETLPLLTDPSILLQLDELRHR